MSAKTVPFVCIPDIAKERLLLGDDLSFKLFMNEGEPSMIVEATRLGADKRKITGCANMDKYQILRLWAGLDKLVKGLGLEGEVQTEAEHDQERIEKNAQSSENFLNHRRRMLSSTPAETAADETTKNSESDAQ
jgi:hypothetical protein